MHESTALNQIDPAEALARIEPLIQRTPVLRSKHLSEAGGCELIFKCEHLQETGSFKLRGASHAVARLVDDGFDRPSGDADQSPGGRWPGVATHSSGNHGAALAAAASARGLEAHVVMPENSVRTKVEAVRRYGGQVHFCAPTQAAREQGLAEWVKQGYVPIPPYDHDDIIAGQGTLAVEFLHQVEDLDMLVAPIGGGGLLAGITLTVAHSGRPIRVIGAEPAGADDAMRSLAAGAQIQDHHPDTIADGLRALVGQRNLAILAAHQIEVLTVSDEQILQAMQRLWTELKQVIEPSGAVALAAVLNHPEVFAGRKVGVVLSGGNLDVQPFFRHLEAL